MKCPLCGGNNAYIHPKSDIVPGKDIAVYVVCDDCGQSGFNAFADAKIDVVLKRGSMEFDQDYCDVINERLKLSKKGGPK